MKFNYKKTIISISLILLLLISSTIHLINIDLTNFTNKEEIAQKEQQHQIENNENLRISGSWNIDFIHIKNDNWSATALPWIIIGDGTKNNPHIIENVTLNGYGRTTGILIENCSKHFEIRNCTIFNCGIEDDSISQGSSIMFFNSSNGRILNNNCSNNFISGIRLKGSCENNTIFNNTIIDNQGTGIVLDSYFKHCQFTNISKNSIIRNGAGILSTHATNTTIFNNTINFNLGSGINMEINCDNTTIYRNIVNGNGYTPPDIDPIYGICLWEAKNCNISENIVNYNNGPGIRLNQAIKSIVKNNTVTNNEEYGISFYGKDSIVVNNTLINCGIKLPYSYNSIKNCIIDSTNKINGKSFYYYYNKTGLVNANFIEAGQIFLLNCNNTKISSMIITNTSDAISLIYCHNSTIENNQIHNNKKTAIEMYMGNNHSIKHNNLTNNEIGINLDHISNVTLLSNNMTKCGISFDYTFGFDSIKISIDTSNKVNNKPVYFYFNLTKLNFDDFINAGQVLLVKCNHSSIKNQNLSYGSVGLYLKSCINISLSNITSNYNKLHGIDIYYCRYLNITNCFFQYNQKNGINGFYCILSNFKNNSIDYNKFYGINTELFGGNNIRDNKIIYNGRFGMDLDDASNNMIKDNTINNNAEFGIRIDSGLYNSITKNIIENNLGSGISIDDSDYNNITENIIKNNLGSGIEIQADFSFFLSRVHYIFNNTIENNKMKGIYLLYCENITCIKNNINKNDNGVIMENCNKTIIENNFIINHTINGIELITCNYTKIKGNALINNTNIGIYISSDDSVYNSIYNNTFIKNRIHAIENGFNNDWNSSLIGNYWDNYTGYDDDGDGIGDYSYLIDEGYGEGEDEMPIWDGLKPSITISIPINESTYSIAPNFNVKVSDDVSNTVWYHHLVNPIIQIDKLWYIINSSTPKLYFSPNETINPTEWQKFGNGTIIITFYVNDTCGNFNFTSVLIYKDTSATIPPVTPSSDGNDDDDNGSKEESDIFKFIMSPLGLTIILGTIVVLALILVIKIRKSNRSRIKEIELIKKVKNG